MSSPSLSNTSHSNSGSTLKTGQKRRGRPMKRPFDETEAKIDRRARVRRAQQAFRRRKKEALESLEQRILTLEDTIEQMSTVFMMLYDSILNSDAVHKDPDAVNQLYRALGQFVALARTATKSPVLERPSTGEGDINENATTSAGPTLQGSNFAGVAQTEDSALPQASSRRRSHDRIGSLAVEGDWMSRMPRASQSSAIDQGLSEIIEQSYNFLGSVPGNWLIPWPAASPRAFSQSSTETYRFGPELVGAP